jgi:hypothetical protein
MVLIQQKAQKAVISIAKKQIILYLHHSNFP